MPTLLRAVVAGLLSFGIGACSNLPTTNTEAELVEDIEVAKTCSDYIESSQNTIFHKAWPAQGIVISHERLMRAATKAETRYVLSEYSETFGNKWFTNRWTADRALLLGRTIVERYRSNPRDEPNASDFNLCVLAAQEAHPAEAWELRGLFAALQHNPERRSFAYFALGKAASLYSRQRLRLRALRLQRSLADLGLSTCQWRVAQYYEASDQHYLLPTDKSGPNAPNDALSDYDGSWFNSRKLESLRTWTFPNVPRCRDVDDSTYLRAGSDQFARVLKAAFAQTTTEENPNSLVCDAFDFDSAFNPNSGGTGSGPLGAFGSIFSNFYRMAHQQRRLLNSPVNQLLADLLHELRSNLPASHQALTINHTVQVPLAPTIFARERECTIAYYWDTRVFIINNDPVIVISSAAVRHAMLSAVSELASKLSIYTSEAAQIAFLQKQFKVGLAFLMAHELAHAYAPGGRTLGVSERQLDCLALNNVVATYGQSSSLGVFGSVDYGDSPERIDAWRLWGASTPEAMSSRVRVSRDRLELLHERGGTQFSCETE